MHCSAGSEIQPFEQRESKCKTTFYNAVALSRCVDFSPLSATKLAGHVLLLRLFAIFFCFSLVVLSIIFSGQTSENVVLKESCWKVFLNMEETFLKLNVLLQT